MITCSSEESPLLLLLGDVVLTLTRAFGSQAAFGVQGFALPGGERERAEEDGLFFGTARGSILGTYGGMAS